MIELTEEALKAFEDVTDGDEDPSLGPTFKSGAFIKADHIHRLVEEIRWLQAVMKNHSEFYECVERTDATEETK